jgi:SAM-dependent methyltransferase
MHVPTQAALQTIMPALRQQHEKPDAPAAKIEAGPASHGASNSQKAEAVTLKTSRETAPVGGMTRERLLAEINQDVPPGIDWKAGAHRYLSDYLRKAGSEKVRSYVLAKPFVPFEVGAGDYALFEAVYYLDNLVNLIRLLKMPAESKVLDVACGAGWVSHYLTKFNYKTWGFDISSDFVDLVRERIASDDTLLPVNRSEVEQRFRVHDIEVDVLPSGFGPTSGFDAIVLESCLHHFMDPITALTNLADVLAPGGLMVIIEGENRKGPIKEEFVRVMRETETLERPYPRELLVQVLKMAGLPANEFVGAANGWVGTRSPFARDWGSILAQATEAANIVVCAKDTASLARIFPYLEGTGSSP